MRCLTQVYNIVLLFDVQLIINILFCRLVAITGTIVVYRLHYAGDETGDLVDSFNSQDRVMFDTTIDEVRWSCAHKTIHTTDGVIQMIFRYIEKEVPRNTALEVKVFNIMSNHCASPIKYQGNPNLHYEYAYMYFKVPNMTGVDEVMLLPDDEFHIGGCNWFIFSKGHQAYANHTVVKFSWRKYHDPVKALEQKIKERDEEDEKFINFIRSIHG